MHNVISNRLILSPGEKLEGCKSKARNLTEVQINKEYTIEEVNTCDEELKNFLFTLGCYKGETVTVLSFLGENYIISVKDSRYSVDKDLAQAIMV